MCRKGVRSSPWTTPIRLDSLKSWLKSILLSVAIHMNSEPRITSKAFFSSCYVSRMQGKPGFRSITRSKTHHLRPSTSFTSTGRASILASSRRYGIWISTMFQPAGLPCVISHASWCTLVLSFATPLISSRDRLQRHSDATWMRHMPTQTNRGPFGAPTGWDSRNVQEEGV